MTESKNVLITGASRGIGKAIAKLLVEEGHNVFLTARNKDMLKTVCHEIGAKGYFAIDLCEKGAVEKLVKLTAAAYGDIDVLVNNAGLYVYSAVEKTDETDIDNMLAVNIKAPFELIKYVVPMMKKKRWGRIVNIGSISGIIGEANASLYSMTKSAYTGMTKALALELAADGITVNTINPGWVDTEMGKKSVNDSEFSYEENIETIPQRRFIEPVEIAHLVNYLISDGAKGLTGQSISLCAGLSCG